MYVFSWEIFNAPQLLPDTSNRVYLCCCFSYFFHVCLANVVVFPLQGISSTFSAFLLAVQQLLSHNRTLALEFSKLLVQVTICIELGITFGCNQTKMIFLSNISQVIFENICCNLQMHKLFYQHRTWWKINKPILQYTTWSCSRIEYFVV